MNHNPQPTDAHHADQPPVPLLESGASWILSGALVTLCLMVVATAAVQGRM